MGERGLDYTNSGQRKVTGCCEDGNEPSDSIKCGELLEYLNNY